MLLPTRGELRVDRLWRRALPQTFNSQRKRAASRGKTLLIDPELVMLIWLLELHVVILVSVEVAAVRLVDVTVCAVSDMFPDTVEQIGRVIGSPPFGATRPTDGATVQRVRPAVVQRQLFGYVLSRGGRLPAYPLMPRRGLYRTVVVGYWKRGNIYINA